MSTIRTMEAGMPPGFRFHPRDDELVLHYLLHKLSGRSHARCGVAMVDVDLNKCEPWELPDESFVGGNEWYFFSLRDRKYTTGHRTNRATRSGYWKATGKDRAIVADKKAAAAVVGMRKTLVFYRGRAPKGRKTEWVMHEFRLEPQLSQLPAAGHYQCDRLIKEDWVLCRVFYKSRTTTPTLTSEDHAGMPSCEPNLTAAPPNEPLTTTCSTFDGSRTEAEQMSYLSSGLPAVPFRRQVNLGDLLAIDTCERQAMGIMIGSMTSMISSGLELAPCCEQENDLAQIWNLL